MPAGRGSWIKSGKRFRWRRGSLRLAKIPALTIAVIMRIRSLAVRPLPKFTEICRMVHLPYLRMIFKMRRAARSSSGVKFGRSGTTSPGKSFRERPSIPKLSRYHIPEATRAILETYCRTCSGIFSPAARRRLICSTSSAELRLAGSSSGSENSPCGMALLR